MAITDLPSSGVHLAYFMILGSMAGVFILKLTEYLLQRLMIKIRYEFILASSIFYLFGTNVVETAFHPGVAFALYLSPVMLYTTIRGIEESKIRYLLLSSIIFSLVVVDLHFLIFGPIIFLSYILYDAIYKIFAERNSKLDALKRMGLYIGVIVVPGLLLNAYWIIPSITSGGLDLYSTPRTKDDFTLLYRNADILNALSGRGFFNLDRIYSSAYLQTGFLSLILTLIALPSLYFYRNKIVTFLG
ncbi:MAG: hypothetical protein HRF40_00845, partial [Nitrososphaera sp.]